ncbi:hypothetical protein HAX54_019455 [Datura stramonium]|uniref:Uncharacterized protein n=1 Tax=Datura stramonium TaxID=4076 RepID=A0ABS8UP72_DATST|nr:hypothetical protein [Datura stramonium]
MPSIENSISLPSLATLPPPIEEPLGLPVEPSSVASPSSSMETTPTSLSPEETSLTTSSATSTTPVDLATLISDIRGRYAPPDSALKSSSPETSALAGSASPSNLSDESLAQDSLFDSASENDLVPISALKKGAQKRKLTSSQEVGSGSKNHCVLDPTFRTRARWNSSYGSTAIPKPTIPKSKVKPFSQTKAEIVDFFKNFSISRGCVTARVGNVLVVFDSIKLGSWLGISCSEFATCQKNKWPDLPPPLTPLEIVGKFSGDSSRTSVSKVLKRSMSSYHKFLFTFVIRNLIPRQERRDVASYLDLTLMELLDRGMPINLPALMIAYLNKVVHDVNKNHALPYGFLLTSVFAKWGVHFSFVEHYLPYDALDYYESRGTRHVGVMGGSSSATGSSPPKENSAVLNLELENKHLRLEIEQLKAQLARNEDTAMARHQDLMALIRSLSPSIVPSSSVAPPTDPNP